MNKDAIIKTAVTKWQVDDDCFVTESPLAETISGVGDTPEEAYQVFLDMVALNHEAYQAGQHALYTKPGRPKKGKIALRAEVNPEIKQEIVDLATALGVSHGEAVEFLFKSYEAAKTIQDKETRRSA